MSYTAWTLTCHPVWIHFVLYMTKRNALRSDLVSRTLHWFTQALSHCCLEKARKLWSGEQALESITSVHYKQMTAFFWFFSFFGHIITILRPGVDINLPSLHGKTLYYHILLGTFHPLFITIVLGSGNKIYENYNKPMHFWIV